MGAVPVAQPPAQPAGARRAVTARAVTVGAATGTYGVSFGALAVTAGLTPVQAVALSLLMFTGGSQFALVGVLGAGGGAVAATASAGLLGVRNGFYGLQLAPLLGVGGWRRLLAGHLTIDESTAVALAQPTPELRRLGFWATGVSVLVLWSASTALGAVLGDALGDPRRFGLDAAAGAALLGLLWPRLRRGEVGAVAVVAAGLALAAVPLAPAGVPVLVAVLAVPVVLAAVALRARSSRDAGPAAAGGDR